MKGGSAMDTYTANKKAMDITRKAIDAGALTGGLNAKTAVELAEFIEKLSEQLAKSDLPKED
jgi:hypothetical protein